MSISSLPCPANCGVDGAARLSLVAAPNPDLLLAFLQHSFKRLAEAAPGTVKNYRIAIGHLQRFLGRPPRVGDLSAEKIVGVMDRLRKRGRSVGTARCCRSCLVALSHAAAEQGQLPEPARIAKLKGDRRTVTPWGLDELNRLLGSARTMPGAVGDVPARLWWSALVLTLLDAGRTAAEALAAPRESYDRHAGTLAVGCFVMRLHPLTIEALEAIVSRAGERLWAWPWDKGKPPFYTLYRRYKGLLYRAGLPYTSGNLFNRLQITAAALPDVLDRVNLKLPFTPIAGKLKLPRARDRRHWARERKKPGGRADPMVRDTAGRSWRASQIVLISSDSPRTLGRFFREVYAPRRLPAPKTISKYAENINCLASFAGCQVTLDQLSDDLVEGFLAWVVKGGRTPATANSYARSILALWRYARRKRLLDSEPCVEFLREPKRLPEAWNVEEVGRILDTCATLGGDVAGIPARAWWPAFILVLYDTGLRLQAVLLTRTERLDLKRGLLLIPAQDQKQNADQMCRLSPDTVAALALTRPEERDLIFPTPWATVQPLRKRYRRILRAASLSDGARDLFHRLRRTSVTYVYDRAGEAAAVEHAGHSSAQVTRTYIDRTKVDRLRGPNVLPRPVWNSAEGGAR